MSRQIPAPGEQNQRNPVVTSEQSPVLAQPTLEQSVGMLQQHLPSVVPNQEPIIQAAQQHQEHIQVQLNQQQWVQAAVQPVDLEFTTKFTDIQKGFIEFYKENENSITLTPLVVENEVRLSELYVRPDLVKLELSRDGKFFEKQDETKIVNYQDLLLKDKTTAYKRIYVTGEGGSGKTSLTKHLCQTWCKAQETCTEDNVETGFLLEDINALKYFDCLFLISLRDVDKTICSVNHMIQVFVESNFSNDTYENILNIDKILARKTCLVILDGLDEWNHVERCQGGHKNPSIPFVKMWPKCSILTTSRPWKLDEGRVTDIDCQVVIKGLNIETSSNLVSKAIKLFKGGLPQDELNSCERHFFQQTSMLPREDLFNIQYINLQMVCLWNEGKSIGTSISQVYINLMEATLARKKVVQGEMKTTDCAIPAFLNESDHKECRKSHRSMSSLGKLALNTLLDSQTVLDKEAVLRFFKGREEILNFGLHTGLLTQSRNTASLSKRCSNVSFQHKTIQEFLAAWYIQSDLKVAFKQITDACKSLESVLDLSFVFVFMSGLNPKSFSELFQELIHKVVAEDKDICQYRSMLVFAGFHGERIYSIMSNFQKLQIRCLQESLRNGHEDLVLPFEDILIVSESDKYMSIFEKVTSRGQANIKSLLVRQCKTTEQFTEYCEHLNIQNFDSLESLDLMTFTSQRLEQIFSKNIRTLKSINVRNFTYSGGRYEIGEAEFPMKCQKLLREMPCLQALSLYGISVEHKQLEDLIDFVSENKKLKEIGLKKVFCLDHVVCEGFCLNLQSHESLCGLYLHSVPISELKWESHSLSNCQIGFLSSSVVASFLQKLPDAHNLERLFCIRYSLCHLSVLEAVIPKLTQLKCLLFYRMNLRENAVPLSSEMKSLEWVVLEHVKIKNKALEKLFEVVRCLESTVTVKLWDCSVTPEDEYRNTKKKIEETENVLVQFDSYNEDDEYIFCFQIIQCT